MSPEKYLDLKDYIIKQGYSLDIDWAEGLKPCEDHSSFFTEYVYVVCNSGMKNTVALQIFDRVMRAIGDGKSVHSAFGHKGKADAIEKVWLKSASYFLGYLERKTDKGKIEYLETLPWIGKITKYHLAKNLGITSVAKPDRHLERIAKSYNTTPQMMCEKLSNIIGDTVAVVDLVIWRAASLGYDDR